MNETEDLWALPFRGQPMLRAQRTYGQITACCLHRAARALANRVEAIAAALLRRHLVRLLRQFDSRMLDDIGIERADIDEPSG